MAKSTVNNWFSSFRDIRDFLFASLASLVSRLRHEKAVGARQRDESERETG